MARSKLVQKNEKIAEAVVDGYQKIEDSVVGVYKKVEKSVVDGFSRISDRCRSMKSDKMALYWISAPALGATCVPLRWESVVGKYSRTSTGACV